MASCDYINKELKYQMHTTLTHFLRNYLSIISKISYMPHFTMAIFYYAATLVMAILYLLHRRRCCSNPLFIDWPILGMLPQVLCNLWQINDYATNVLRQKGGTGEFMGPWFTKMNYMITSDPMNVHHIMSKSFDNYVKGDDFREIFQALGNGVAAADGETWKYTRTLHHSLFRMKSFETLVEKTFQKKVEGSLLPILDHVRQQGAVVDLQDVFSRLTFDETCSLVLGYDPNCLSIEFPHVAVEKAFDEIEESIFYRHTVPKSVWKFQKWLQIGEEKKMTKACRVFDQLLYAWIATKRQQLSKCNKTTEVGEVHFDLLSALMMREEKGGPVHDDQFLRDAAVTLFVAGRDTITSALTWFFWLVAKNPSVEANILKEIKDNFGPNDKVLGVEKVKNLVYLHATLCETLRLFPAVPIERKEAINSDTLPSGHHVNQNTIILLFMYAMARFDEIWGKDCLEFKPERWISEKGGIVYVPSYKFFSFNAGPRTCPGKDISFIQLKMVASAILRNYCVLVVEGHDATPSYSVVLLMKHGLKVKITKREI